MNGLSIVFFFTGFTVDAKTQLSKNTQHKVAISPTLKSGESLWSPLHIPDIKNASQSSAYASDCDGLLVPFDAPCTKVAVHAPAFYHFFCGVFIPAVHSLLSRGCLDAMKNKRVLFAKRYIFSNYPGKFILRNESSNFSSAERSLMVACDRKAYNPRISNTQDSATVEWLKAITNTSEIRFVDAWTGTSSGGSFLTQRRWVDEQCDAGALAAIHLQRHFSIPPRKKRRLRLVFLVRHSPREARNIINNNEVTTKLSALCGRLGLEFAAVYPHELSPVEQLRNMASADIVVSMHGSAIPVAVLQPPRSITFEINPTGWSTDQHANCVSNQERLYISGYATDAFEYGKCSFDSMRLKTCGISSSRNVNIAPFTLALEEAFLNGSGPIGRHINCHPGKVYATLRQWLEKDSSTDPTKHNLRHKGA